MKKETLPKPGSQAHSLYLDLLSRDCGTALSTKVIARDIIGGDEKDVSNVLSQWVADGLFEREVRSGVAHFWLHEDHWQDVNGVAQAAAAPAAPAAPLAKHIPVIPPDDAAEIEPLPFACALYNDGDLVLLNSGTDGDVDITLPKAQASTLVRYLMSFAHEDAKAG